MRRGVRALPRRTARARVSDVYPALARQRAGRSSASASSATDGGVVAAGDADVEFTIMSVSKPFVFALVCEALGAERARDAARRQRAPACRSTRSTAVEQSADGRTNPMVNPGAIATTSLVPGATRGERWELVHDGLSRFAGRDARRSTRRCTRSASATNSPQPRHRPAARGLRPARLRSRARRSTSTRGSARSRVTAHDLAAMGATLADGGVNPLTGERVVDAETAAATRSP